MYALQIAPRPSANYGSALTLPLIVLYVLKAVCTACSRHMHDLYAEQLTVILSFADRLRQHFKAPRSAVKGQGGHGQDLLVSVIFNLPL